MTKVILKNYATGKAKESDLEVVPTEAIELKVPEGSKDVIVLKTSTSPVTLTCGAACMTKHDTPSYLPDFVPGERKRKSEKIRNGGLPSFPSPAAFPFAFTSCLPLRLFHPSSYLPFVPFNSPSPSPLSPFLSFTLNPPILFSSLSLSSDPLASLCHCQFFTESCQEGGILLLNMPSLVDASIYIPHWYDKDYDDYDYISGVPKLIASFSNLEYLSLKFGCTDKKALKKELSNCPTFNNLKYLKLVSLALMSLILHHFSSIAHLNYKGSPCKKRNGLQFRRNQVMHGLQL